MPISTNAPFNEFGQSQILRDIEQLYLALNGAGSGGPGDGQTQDQTAVTSQDSGGLPDLSNLATIPYVDAAIAAIPSVTYPISIANGGTGAVTVSSALLNLLLTSGTYVERATGTFSLPGKPCIIVVIGAGGAGSDYYSSASRGALATSGSTVYNNQAGSGGGAGGANIIRISKPITGNYTVSVGSGGIVGGANGGGSSVTVAGRSFGATGGFTARNGYTTYAGDVAIPLYCSGGSADDIYYDDTNGIISFPVCGNPGSVGTNLISFGGPVGVYGGIGGAGFLKRGSGGSGADVTGSPAANGSAGAVLIFY